MIKSMTGYGRSESGDVDRRLVVEIRSLNNRYLDVLVKSPRMLIVFEPRIKKMVQERFTRGRFEMFISFTDRQTGSNRLIVNETMIGEFIAALREIKTRHGLAGDVDVATVSSLAAAFSVEESEGDVEGLWGMLSEAVAHALDDLERMRGQEGQALTQDVRSRLAVVGDIVSAITARTPCVVENARNRMTDAVTKLLREPVEPQRIAQEIAILAERTDVSEELTRLGSHMVQFERMLTEKSRDGVGRKLDFLIQEMGREVNTIGSKAMDAEIAQHVVAAKSELEKIREQVQNVE